MLENLGDGEWGLLFVVALLAEVTALEEILDFGFLLHCKFILHTLINRKA